MTPMTARELLVKLTGVPEDQIVPGLTKPIAALQDDEILDATTSLIEYKITEIIGTMADGLHTEVEVEYHALTVPFMKLPNKLNENTDWDVVHIYLAGKADGVVNAWVLVTRPVEDKEDEQ